MQPRIFYPVRLFFRIEEKISIFPGKQKLKELVTIKPSTKQGTWVDQSVKCPPPGFSSGNALIVHEIEPHVGLHAVSQSILGIPSLSARSPLVLSLSLSLSLKNKLINFKKCFKKPSSARNIKRDTLSGKERPKVTKWNGESLQKQ